MENSTSFTNPNSKIWLCSLLSYFINIKSIDDNIELIRISLCSQPNFSPYKLFNFLDKSSKGFILLNDLIIFLREMQIPFEEKYLRIFIHNFDKDADFSLNLNEFLGLILPKKNMDFSKNMKSTELDDNTYEIISINVKNIFGKLICEELELVKNCIKTAKSCKENTGFTLYEAFVEIAGTSRYICEQNLFDFFRKNNIDINKNDMHQLMFRLDADNDGKISFDEFQDIFFPIKENINEIENKKNINNKIIKYASLLYKQCYETPYLPKGYNIKLVLLSNYYKGIAPNEEIDLLKYTDIGFNKIEIFDEEGKNIIKNMKHKIISNCEIFHNDIQNENNEKLIINGAQNENGNNCLFYLFDTPNKISYIKFYPLKEKNKSILNSVKEIKIFCDCNIIFEGELYLDKPTVILFTSEKKIVNEIDENYLTKEINERSYKEEKNEKYISLMLN